MMPERVTLDPSRVVDRRETLTASLRQMEWWLEEELQEQPQICISCNRRRARRDELVCKACCIT